MEWKSGKLGSGVNWCGVFGAGGVEPGFDPHDGASVVQVLGVLWADGAGRLVEAHLLGIGGVFVGARHEQEADVQLGDVVEHRQHQHHEGKAHQEVTCASNSR